MNFKAEQQAFCDKYGVPYHMIDTKLKVGISRDALKNTLPLNGLRHPIKGDTSGWYIWSGEELSENPDYFVPIHIEHLGTILPQIMKYLAIPPGWRFLFVSSDYEDVWQDDTLLDI